MTTVLVTNGFIITDKRSTQTGRGHDKHLHDPGSDNIKSDNCVKISVQPYFRRLRHKGKRVMAVANAGSFAGFLSIESFLKKSTITELSDLAAAGYFFYGTRSVSLVALLEDGTTCAIVLNGSFDIAESQSESNHIGRAGSGSKYFDLFFVKLLSSGQLHAEEVFLYMASRDSSSSINYSVYSLEEDTLFTNVRPKKEDYLAKVKKAHLALEPGINIPKRHHYGY